jgi:hypothetical protein
MPSDLIIDWSKQGQLPGKHAIKAFLQEEYNPARETFLAARAAALADPNLPQSAKAWIAATAAMLEQLETVVVELVLANITADMPPGQTGGGGR